MIAIELENVTKRYGPHVAVDGLDLRVPEGSVCGFIGPNGSGKTTTLRMIMRIIYPNSGTIRVLGGAEIGAGANAHRVGYLPEERGLYKVMKVIETLRYISELKGCPMSKSDIQAWLDRMEIGEWGNKKIDALSKGMAQKVQFIAAILGDPELIILDEPFTGLDPVNANLFRNMILDRRRTGATIILSTHDMSVAEKMCDRIFMIFKGRKVLDGSLEKVQQEYGDDTIRVRLESNGQSLDRVDGVSEVNDFGQYQELRLADGADSQEVLSRLMGMGRVRHFELARPSLHDIFVRIAGPEGARAQADTMQDGGWLEMEAPARA